MVPFAPLTVQDDRSLAVVRGLMLPRGLVLRGSMLRRSLMVSAACSYVATWCLLAA